MEQDVEDGEMSSPLVDNEEQDYDEDEKVTSPLGGFHRMCGGYFCLFFSFFTVQNLESSLNAKLGYFSLAVLYFAFACATFISPALVAKLGMRHSFFVGGLAFVVFMVANLYPSWATLMPCGILQGVGASVLWTAQGKFMTGSAVAYAQASGISNDAAASKFNGIFFAYFYFAQAAGNLMVPLMHKLNVTVHNLMVVFTISSCIGAASFLSLPKLDTGKEDSAVTVADTLNLLVGERAMMLIVPSIVYNGLSLGFIFGDLTGEINSSLGSDYIGFIMAAFGVANAVTSITIGKYKDKMKPQHILNAGLALHVIFILFYLEFFHEQPHLLQAKKVEHVHFFIGAVLFGVGDALVEVMQGTLLCNYFPSRAGAAFANLKCWQSVGLAAALLYGPYLHASLKLLLVFSFLVISSVCINMLPPIKGVDFDSDLGSDLDYDVDVSTETVP
jgi:MFS family permease